MRSPSVIHSSSGTPSVSVWTGSILSTNAALVPGRPDIITQSAATQVIATRSNSTAASWCLSSQGRPPQWLYTGASARLQPIPAFDSPPQRAAGAPMYAAAPTVPEPDTQRAPGLEKIELVIDSLPNYAVTKPIPVLVESLGDKVFIAEVPDLNLSSSGNSVGAALLALKEQIVATYEGNRTRRGQDSERARQVSVLDQYISDRHGRSAGSWSGVWGSR